MNRIASQSSSSRLALLAACLAAFGASSSLRADTVDISLTPVDVTASVAPNIVMTFDDSGSMDNDYMPDNRPYDGGSWSGPWRCAGVIDDTAAAGDVKAKPMNGVYFNPNLTYPVPKYQDGSNFPTADGTLAAVLDDGMNANRPNNPTGTTTTTAFNGQRVTVRVCVAWQRNKPHTDQYCTQFQNQTTDSRWSCPADNTSPLGDSGGPYYYRYTGGSFINSNGTVNTTTLYNSSNWTAVAVPASKYQDWANWWSYYRTRNQMARTSVSIAFADFTDNVRVAYQNIDDDNYKLPASTIISEIGIGSTQRVNFYNWLFKVNPTGNTPNRRAVIRANEFFRRDATVQDGTNPYWNGKTGAQFKALSCRRNFNMLVTDGYWNESNQVCDYNNRGGCSTNYGQSIADMLPSDFSTVTVHKSSITLPDAMTYKASGTNEQVYSNVPVNGNGNCSSTGSTDCYPSLADIAFYYWAKDLQPSAAMPNRVAPYMKSKTGNTDKDYFNPVNDPATWQHVSQFMITLGVAGKLTYPDDLANLISGATAWPQPKRNSPEAIDDTWHAALNSRGGFFNANDPNQLVSKLQEFLTAVLARSGSAVSGSLNTGVVSDVDGAVNYVTAYDSASWLGTLTAKAVDKDGNLGAEKWTASIDTSTRQVLTATDVGTGKGVAFNWSKISSAEQAALNKTPAGVTDSNGSTRLTAVRNQQLGALIYSQPVFVSYPNTAISDYKFASTAPERAAGVTSYESFAYGNANRQKTVYVGANDGMLHAFNADTGAEMWAYVPATVYPILTQLAVDGHGLVAGVDNTPVVSDAFFKKAGDSAAKWHTVLVGTLRLGGKGVFALDVTDPKNVTESTAGANVLWEFNSTSAGGGNLGYTFGNPNIGRLANGRWVVLVSGGYFPTGDTSAPALRKQSSLFVIDLETGKLLKEFVTTSGVNSWGLAGPVLGDYEDDQIDDFAYAGDLVGNLWRFDLSTVKASGTESNSTGVDRVFKPATEGIQPITSMPRLFPDPSTGNVIVLFGTGQYLSPKDVKKEDIQAFYGIRDYRTGSANYPITIAKLLKQTLSGGLGADRSLTTTDITTQLGWYFNLDQVAGERNVVTPGALFNTARAILTTLIPSGGSSDPCNPGRLGTALQIDALSGGAPVHDRNGFATNGATPATFTVGIDVANPPVVGTVPMATLQGGGKIVLPGISLEGSGTPFMVPDSIWKRRSWRTILEQ